LDILRKHRRLLAVQHGPAEFRVTGWFHAEHFAPLRVPRGYVPAKDETVLGFFDKRVSKSEVHYASTVFLREAEPPLLMPILIALREFATLADRIIKLFDL